MGSNLLQAIPLSDQVRNDPRYSRLIDHYTKVFSALPSFVVRVPGRVNLIGEHIDYCGYAVFPMAIEQDIIMAVGHNAKHRIVLTNLENNYEDFKCNVDKIEFPVKPSWYHYFLCGYKGVTEKFLNSDQLFGINVAVHGTVPAASGLSSSSAMVCASALSTMFCWNLISGMFIFTNF